jgi:hypothetical protein
VIHTLTLTETPITVQQSGELENLLLQLKSRGVHSSNLLSESGVDWKIDSNRIGSPIQEEGDGTIVFTPQSMRVGYPYPFTFLNHPMVAIKDAEGEMSVYYFPK